MGPNKLNSNNQKTNNPWDALAEMASKSRGEVITKGGVILVGRAAEEYRKEMEKEEKKDYSEESNDKKIEGGYFRKPSGEDLRMSSPAESANDRVIEMPVNKVVAKEGEPVHNDTSVIEMPVDKKLEQSKDFVYEEVQFLQADDKAKELKKNPELLTYLVNNDKGFAIKREEAVDIFIDKITKSENPKDINQAKALEREMLYGTSNMSDEEKKRVAEFKKTPIYQIRDLQSLIDGDEKVLRRWDDEVERCQENYDKMKRMNVVSKFLNRFKIKEARSSLESAIARKNNTTAGLKERKEKLASLLKAHPDLDREKLKAA